MKSSSQLQPWHYILFAVAIVLVLWQVMGYVLQKRKQSTGTYRQGEVYVSPQLTPQQQQYRQMIESEK
ncbi:MAG: hypothetical protein RMM08_12530 [Armatimonadota bacterium]|nr:hypothetical protein [Armatimonadota bacterium]